MPTVIMLDVSLSMCRTIPNAGNQAELKQLAAAGIGTLLDYFAQNAQLEQVAFVVYSSFWEIKQNFTRQYESIKNIIYELEVHDKSNILNAIKGLQNLDLEENFKQKPINIIIVTDGILDSSLVDDDSSSTETETSYASEDSDIGLESLNEMFNLPCKVQVVCLASQIDSITGQSIPFFKKLVSMLDSSSKEVPLIVGPNMRGFRQSAIWLLDKTDTQVTIDSTEKLFNYIAEKHYSPDNVLLSCGNLSSSVVLNPKLNEININETIVNTNEKIDSNKKSKKETSIKATNDVLICGFLSIAEMANPAVMSRHSVFPINSNKSNDDQLSPPSKKANSLLKKQQDRTEEMSIQEENQSNFENKVKLTNSKLQVDISKKPSFCTLLHLSLKQESMVAICQIIRVEENTDLCFGMIHSYTDSKKKSSLMLSLFKPGSKPVPWLPDFRTLTTKSLFAQVEIDEPVKESSHATPNSYSSITKLWLDPESIQSDLQKVVRHGRRLPARAKIFLDEVNQIRRAALSYGFQDVLFNLAIMLERELEIAKLDLTRNKDFILLIEGIIVNLKSKLTPNSYETNINLNLK